MLTALVIFFIIVIIVSCVSVYKMRNNDTHKKETTITLALVCGIPSAVLAIIIGCICIGFWCDVATEHVIDQKIAMYQEENAKIEAQIDTIVKEYMLHETETFENVSPDSDTMVLVSLFPELKSDELIKQQMNLYTANAAEIKNMKESKIDLVRKKWLLYFGR